MYSSSLPGLFGCNDLLDFLDRFGGVTTGLLSIGGLVRFISNHAGLRAKQDDVLPMEAAWLKGFVSQHYRAWEARHADPINFLVSVLRSETWESQKLRRLLGIGLEEAEVFLTVCGYAYDPGTKRHVLRRDAKRFHIRGLLVGEFVGYDPATWEEDVLGAEQFKKYRPPHPPQHMSRLLQRGRARRRSPRR